MPVFGLQVPESLDGVPGDILMPSKSWTNKEEYEQCLKKLAQLFVDNFKQYAEKCPSYMIQGGPQEEK